MFFKVILFNWTIITLQYCDGFCHTSTWISHGCTYVPHPESPSHLPPHPIPLGCPRAPALSALLYASNLHWSSIFSSVAQSCPTLCYPLNCIMPGFCVLHCLPKFVQTHVHWVGDAIQPSHPLSPPSPPALSLTQHQGLFQWMGCSHQVAKVLEFQFQHQSFQRIFMVDFL